MEALTFLQDLTLVLLTAAAVLLLFNRLKQPPVLGYLAAGLLLGQHGPLKLISDLHSLEALSQIGVVFLLFALGVEFNLKRLAAVGAKALVCAGVETALMLAVGYALGVLAGLNPMGALLFGAVIGMASTAIVARTLLEGGRRTAPWAELASGTLIAEDILAVALIAFFSSAAAMGEPGLASVLEQLMRFAMLVILVLVPGLLVLPRVLQLVESSGMDEIRTLTIVGACFGVSLLTEKLGFSAALGAFLAGALMSESTTSAPTKLRDTIEPFRDVFGGVFFVAVGMMIDPSWLLGHWERTLLLTLLVAAARLLSNFAAFAAVGTEKVPAAQASLARLPIGEFSFILAQLGDRLGLTDVPLYPMAVVLCLGTTLVSAGLSRSAFERPERIGRVLPSWMDRLLAEYRAGLKRLTVPRRTRMVVDLVRPSIIQIVLNVVGLSGFFLIAGYFQERYDLDTILPGAVWMGVTFVSLPFLLALWRKTQAVTLIFLEVLTTRGAETRPPAEARPLMTRFILGLATLAVAWWYMSLSLALLPPWPHTLIPLALMGLAGALLWRGMNRLYARIQISLRETLAKGHAEPETSATIVSYLVQTSPDASVRIVSYRVGRRCAAVGKPIGELAFLGRSGASILQINRSGEQLPSPDPHVQLRDGDEVLLIGDHDQLESARKMLDSGHTRFAD